MDIGDSSSGDHPSGLVLRVQKEEARRGTGKGRDEKENTCGGDDRGGSSNQWGCENGGKERNGGRSPRAREDFRGKGANRSKKGQEIRETFSRGERANGGRTKKKGKGR